MGIFHTAANPMGNNSPTKAELIAAWLPNQAWGPPTGSAVTLAGSFHIDDPEGEVGMQTHLVKSDGQLFQVPLTYRERPLAGADRALVATMEHAVLGTRWVYDGLGDDRYVMMLAGVAMTGQGHALGMALNDDRWHAIPSDAHVHGGGWTQGPVAIDGFHVDSYDSPEPVFRNDRIELTVFRHPVSGPRPPIGLTATWNGQSTPVVLAAVRDLYESQP